jgi:hypothetical protein
MQWIAHTERDGEPATGSTRVVEAPTAVRAARRAAEAYWRERRSLFDALDASSGQVTVVLVSTQDGFRHDHAEPSGRWRCTVTEDADGNEFSIHADRLA